MNEIIKYDVRQLVSVREYKYVEMIIIWLEIMNEIIQLGNIFENDKNVKLNKNPQPGRVYSIYGIAPTLSTMQGGHKVPYIVLKQNKKES